MTALRGHRQVDHTADLALEIWAPTEEELLLEGARALVGILTEQAPIEADEVRELEVESLDPEDRLVQWLNRVLLLALLDGFLFAGGSLVLTRDGLTASVLGEPSGEDKVRTELKSVTYHDLKLAREGDLWRARIVVDV